MNRYLVAAACWAALTLAPALAWSEETATPVAPAADTQAGSTSSGAAEETKAPALEVRIGADDSAGDSNEKSHGIAIIVDAGDDAEEQADAAGKVADRVMGKVEAVLKKLPADVQMDEDDLRELRQAIKEIEKLKSNGADTHTMHQSDGDDDDNMGAELIPGVVAIVLLFGGPVVIVALVSYNNRRKREMVHQTINKIIEQGRDVPVELLEALDKGKNAKSMLAKGTINVALGIGIGAWLWAVSGLDVATIGLIPLCIGLAQLVNWKLENAQAARGATS